MKIIAVLYPSPSGLTLKLRPSQPALALLLFGVLLVLAGCGVIRPETVVRVDSITGNDTNRKQYVLLPGNKDTSPSDLQFQEFSAYVNRALIKQGFVPAASPTEANLTIFLAYGIGRPQQHQETYSMPALGQGGSTTSTTYVNSYTTHPHFMILEAVDPVDYEQSEDPASLWKTMVTSAATTEDLRKRFPLLVAAAQPYIGRNTGQIVDVTIPEGDPRISDIRRSASLEKTKPVQATPEQSPQPSTIGHGKDSEWVTLRDLQKTPLRGTSTKQPGMPQANPGTQRPTTAVAPTNTSGRTSVKPPPKSSGQAESGKAPVMQPPRPVAANPEAGKAAATTEPLKDAPKSSGKLSAKEAPTKPAMRTPGSGSPFFDNQALW